jgi:hypothetical protein
VTPALLQRLLAFAAVALLAGLVAVAVVQDQGEAGDAAVPAPAAAADADDGWYVALAGSRGLPGAKQRTTCGTLLTDVSLGVSHPVLPCGAKLFLLFDGQEVLTEVVDNRLSTASRQFELTPALAAQLGVEGTQELRWRFAVRG